MLEQRKRARRETAVHAGVGRRRAILTLVERAVVSAAARRQVQKVGRHVRVQNVRDVVLAVADREVGQAVEGLIEQELVHEARVVGAIVIVSVVVVQVSVLVGQEEPLQLG